MSRWRNRARVASALIAVAAAVALVAAPVRPALAAGTTDQITGNGLTDSALTVSWSQGLLGADNKTVVAPRDPNSPLAFMYPDFQNLKVTVGQTENLVHQSIQVTWTGGKPTVAPFKSDFLQMMQCYGDASTGPDPEDCEYGSAGLLPGGVLNPAIGTRQGPICVAGSVASTTNPPGTADGSAPNTGCDTLETDPSHRDAGDTTDYNVPFVPVADPTDKIYDTLTDFFDQFSTNEVQEASTGEDGTGQQFFQTLTATQAPGLGCGQLETNGKARDCWLVIVPRGEFKPNGWQLNGSTGTPGYETDSPLGASNWAQRIQIHLGFDPLQPDCPIGSAQERGTVGTQLVARAVFSWQLALNIAADCKTIYGYAATPEATDTTQLADDTGAGLAFTTIPIGSEAARNGAGTGGSGPPLVYAPVAASAITIGFNINLTAGSVGTPIKLTPRLMAKALTQSYRLDLPDFNPSASQNGPAWATNNPINITHDPEFEKLNPGISDGAGVPLAPLLTEDHSAVNQQVWAWIQADPAARKWLSGTPDENGMVVNPAYASLKLGAAPASDSFPRADQTCFNTGEPGERDPGRCSLDLLPYVNNFDDGASRVRAANNPMGASWDPTKIAPDGETGWWGNGGVEPAGQVFMWAVTDSSDLANYGLVPADLCDADGSSCVAPDTASVTAALSTAKPDSSGLLHVDPAKTSSGAYPLVDVSYAAVRTTQNAAALKDFASLITFAAGPGQTAGVLPGELPHGYLPLPADLRTKANAVAAKLRKLATAQPGSTPTAGTTSTIGSSTTQPTTPAPTGTTPGSPPPSALAGPSISQGPVTAAANSTPRTPVGAVRWVLLTVLIVGLAGAVVGPLLRVRRTRLPLPWRRS